MNSIQMKCLFFQNIATQLERVEELEIVSSSSPASSKDENVADSLFSDEPNVTTMKPIRITADRLSEIISEQVGS